MDVKKLEKQEAKLKVKLSVFRGSLLIIASGQNREASPARSL